MIDRQQIRRDAEQTTRVRIDGIMQDRAGTLAEHCLALLTELEQAELDRDHGQRLLEVERYDRKADEARALELVEALKRYENEAPDWLKTIARDALAAWKEDA